MMFRCIARPLAALSLIATVAALCAVPAQAQTVTSAGTSAGTSTVTSAAAPAAGLVAIHQAFVDSQSDVVVLNVAAHPDDESSRTNTMLRRQHGMRLVTVYSTYGDGGQNAIGREIGPELARIRVRETLRASAMMDVQVQWLGMPDFGYSKTLDETLGKWGRQRLLDAMRRVIDKVDPDVIITNHSLTRGHGHHRASIWAAIEILKERQQNDAYVPQLYARCGVDKAQLVFDHAQLDAVRGRSYADLAYEAWTQHVSQGPWGPHDPLRVGKDYWRVVYPEGVTAEQARDLSRWSREPAGGARLDAGVLRLSDDARKRAVRERLAEVREELRETVRGRRRNYLRRAHVLRRRSLALQRLYVALCGVRVETWLRRDEVPMGGRGRGYVVVHGHERVTDLEISCDGEDAQPVRLPVRQTPFDDRPRRPRLPKPPKLPVTPSNGASNGAAETDQNGSPAEPPRAAPLPGRFEVDFECEYEVDDDLPVGPEPSLIEVDVAFKLEGVRVQLLEPLHYTPVEPIALKWDREVVIVPRGQRSERLLSVSLRNHREMKINQGVKLQMGPGIEAEATPSRLALSKEQLEARILVRASIDADEMTPDAGLAVGFRSATVRLPLRVIDVTVPEGMKVALVRGPEDSTEQTLADLGIDFVTLDRDSLLSTRLQQFSCVLLDIRAYHHRPELAAVRERLQQYCRGGGRIVAMYHKPGEWNERDGHPTLAPFSLVVGNERCTEEDAAVTIVAGSHRLMRHPHVIAASDFDGWVQERGLNFPKKWDSAWTPMLAMKDSGDEKVHEGSLLYTQYGKGDFVYCSLSLYRQLRRGNPGAVRLLVNLLAR